MEIIVAILGTLIFFTLCGIDATLAQIRKIIEKYTELLICKKNNTAIPEPSETDLSALKTVYELAKKCKNPLDMGKYGCV